ncbi:MAG: Uma2 family endonuclease [Polyangiaceae bacterium]
MSLSEQTHQSPATDGPRGFSAQRYVRPPQPIHFPAHEERPVSNRHHELRTALYQILKRELAQRATIGSDQFVYYDPTTATKKLAPDAFVKLGDAHRTFRIWKTWQRGAPDVAVEVVSDSDVKDEAWSVKFARYRASGIAEVVRFDPDDARRPLRVWDNVEGDLVEREKSPDGAFECVCLGLFWVVIKHPEYKRMLRLSRDRKGTDLLPTPEEAERLEIRARQEEAHARQASDAARERLEAEVAELRRQLETLAPGANKSAKKSPRAGRSPARARTRATKK